jgi:hypothetical protein
MVTNPPQKKSHLFQENDHKTTDSDNMETWNKVLRAGYCLSKNNIKNSLCVLY